jgi:parallel beta-helix repeat protein
MTRLPEPGLDAGNWGELLNDYLNVEHNADGTLKRASVIENSEQTTNKAQPGGYASLDATAKIPASQLGGSGGSSSVFLRGDRTWAVPDVRDIAKVFNVKDFGALADGMTDDTAAIQAAINAAASGGTVFLPHGTYVVDPDVSLHLTSGVTLAGSGRKSILKIKPNSNVLDNLVKIENADRVILRDFAVDGNRANQNPSDLIAVHYGVYVATSNDCRVDNLYVYNTTGVGIHVYNSVGTIVTNCESSGHRYHGFECEQDTSTIWQANRSHNNDRHGIFISPGEVGGTGSIGNIIDGNSFDNNGQYGISLGIDAAGLSIGLTKDNIITNNSVKSNAHYGISIYRVDDTLISNNLVAYNGFFGVYLYRAERNQVIGNRLRNNSQASGGAYDEILLEGNNDGQASKHNMLSGNLIYIDGVNKANYGIREATAGDGPNVIKDNYIPSSGEAGRVLIQHIDTTYVLLDNTPLSNSTSLRTFDDGVAIAASATLPGNSMGFDAPFGTAALRFYNGNTGGNIQLVAPNGNLDGYFGGNNTFSVTSTTLVAQNRFRITQSQPPASANAEGEVGTIAWDSNYIYICVAANTWKRSATASW